MRASNAKWPRSAWWLLAGAIGGGILLGLFHVGPGCLYGLLTSDRLHEQLTPADPTVPATQTTHAADSGTEAVSSLVFEADAAMAAGEGSHRTIPRSESQTASPQVSTGDPSTRESATSPHCKCPECQRAQPRIPLSVCWSGFFPAHAARIACLDELGGRCSPSAFLGRALQAADLNLALWMSILIVFVLRLIHGISHSDAGSLGNLSRAVQVIAFFPTFSVAALHLYGISSLVLGQSYIIDFGRPLIVFFASVACGGIFGGLFGLPTRRMRHSTDAKTPGVTNTSVDGESYEAVFGDRLEQVADWLTKVLIGATLAKVGWLWEQMPALNKFLADAAGMPSGSGLATLLAIGGLACGFALGYMAALLFLPIALEAGLRELRRRGTVE